MNNPCSRCAQMERDIENGCTCEYMENEMPGHRWIRITDPNCHMHKYIFDWENEGGQ